MDIVLIFIVSFLILLMQAGFTLVAIGGFSAKNAGHIASRNLANFIVAILAFYFLGYALMFGWNNSGQFPVPDWGHKNLSIANGWENEALADRLVHTLVAATSVPIVAAVLVGRSPFLAGLASTLFLILVVYPIVGGWIWGGGFLTRWGMIDSAGSTVVFSVAGWVALGAALVLGPRREAKTLEDSMGIASGHSFPLLVLGAFLLWVGWWGYYLGALIPTMDLRFSLVGINTLLAGCGGTGGAFMTSWLFHGKPIPLFCFFGLLSGLVAGSGGIDLFRPLSILAVGAVAGGLLCVGFKGFGRLGINDPLGSVSIYGLGGLWGTLAVGLMGEGAPFLVPGEQGLSGWFMGGGTTLLGIQCLGIAVVFLFSFSVSWVFFRLLKMIGVLQVSPEQEQQGLDQAEHGMSAYPHWDQWQKELGHLLEEFKRAKELPLLHDISQTMHTLNLDEILKLILKGVAQGIGFDRVRLYLLDEKKNQLLCRVAVGVEKEKIENLNMPYDPEDNILSRAIRDRRPFIVEDARQDPRVNQGLIRLLEVKSFVAVPLLSRNRVLGGIAADNLISKAEIKESKLKSLMIFANQAALALENALMYEELRAFSAQLEERVRKATEELKFAHRQLLQSEKLAALGKIAAGIAHEIRNPLTSVKILIHSLADEQASPEAREKDLAVIEGEIGRMNKIIKQFLDFARPRPPSLEPTEIEKILEETINLLHYEMEGQKIRLIRDYAAGLPPVPMDPEQMKQVFLNLFLNSIQAMEEGGVLKISTNLTISPPGKNGDSWVEVGVCDTGKGIAEKIQERIFEPFFSTKAEGVGLGLPIAERIVNEHGGKMEVQSEPGRGATFWVRLPLGRGRRDEAGEMERFEPKVALRK